MEEENRMSSLSKTTEAVKRRMSGARDKSRQALRGHPFTAVGVAAGAGLAVGLVTAAALMNRKRKAAKKEKIVT